MDKRKIFSSIVLFSLFFNIFSPVIQIKAGEISNKDKIIEAINSNTSASGITESENIEVTTSSSQDNNSGSSEENGTGSDKESNTSNNSGSINESDKISNSGSIQDDNNEEVGKILDLKPKIRIRRSLEAISQVSPVSDSGTTDLTVSIDGPVEGVNNQNLNYIIEIVNNGPDDAHGSKLKLYLPENIRNISLSCSTGSGSVICPENESIDDGVTEINKVIPSFPVNGSITFNLVMRLPLTPPTSVNLQAEVSVPSGMSDSSLDSNIAIQNTRVVTAKVDLTVIEVSQTKNGETQATENTLKNGFGKELVINNPEPVSFTVKYQNDGHGDADGAGIDFILRLVEEGYYTKPKAILTYENLSFSCSNDNGAECPEEFKIHGNTIPVNGELETSIGYGYNSHSFG